MFEHLDDPEPYAPPAGLRTAVEGRVRRRRRRRVAVAGGVASVAALGVGSVVAVRARLEPDRIEVGGLAQQPRTDTSEAAEGVPVDPTTVLVVGTDRADPDEPGRADTVGLVRIDPVSGEVRLLTVPRDLAVDGVRMSARFEAGGPTGLIEAIVDELGIPVDHYVEVDLAGAVELVDALGGIRVAVDRPIRDDPTGLALGAGCQDLDGAATLALGRARHVQVQQDDGGWAADRWSALGRETRGGVVAAALLQAAGRTGVDDLPGLVATGLGSITVDDSLSSDDLVALARETRDDRLVTFGLPVVDVVVGGAAMLELEEGAAGVVDAFVAGGSGPIPVVGGGAAVVDPTGLRPC